MCRFSIENAQLFMACGIRHQATGVGCTVVRLPVKLLWYPLLHWLWLRNEENKRSVCTLALLSVCLLGENSLLASHWQNKTQQNKKNQQLSCICRPEHSHFVKKWIILVCLIVHEMQSKSILYSPPTTLANQAHPQFRGTTGTLRPSASFPSPFPRHSCLFLGPSVSAGKQRPSTASLVLHPLPFILWHTFSHLPPKAKKILTFSLQMVGASGHSSQVTKLHLMLQGCSSCPPLPLQPQQKPLANALSANLPFSIGVKLQVIQLPDEACPLHQAIQT